MATRKTRKFTEGGMSDEDVKSFAGTPENDSNAGMAEAAAEPKAAPAPAKAKPKIVTKEELAKSGLSLRDYLNKQQGLTRRGESAPKAEAPAKPKYESSYDRMNRENRESGRDFDSLVGKLKDRVTSAGSRGSALPLKSTKAEKNAFMGSTGLKKGGSVKGWGQARGARKAKVY